MLGQQFMPPLSGTDTPIASMQSRYHEHLDMRVTGGVCQPGNKAGSSATAVGRARSSCGMLFRLSEWSVPGYCLTEPAGSLQARARPGRAEHGRTVTVRRHGSYLFLRYAMRSTPPAAEPGSS